MGTKPTLNHSIERIDNDKGYSKDNCVWATRSEQALNKRNTLKIALGGVEKPLVVWAEKVGIPANTIRSRKYKGWSDHDALTIPVSKHNRYVRKAK
jgi:uncharacterized protein YjcR